MSLFEMLVVGGMVLILFALVSLVDAVSKHSRHLSNIADRLLDIDMTMKGKR